MNRYLDFENDIENIESVLSKLDVNKSDYLFKEFYIRHQKIYFI